MVLRVWLGIEMCNLGVVDRFVDVFQGRTPRSVLARYYSGKGRGQTGMGCDGNPRKRKGRNQ